MNMHICGLAVQLLAARQAAYSANQRLFNPTTPDAECEALAVACEDAELLVYDLMTALVDAVISELAAPAPNYLERDLLMLTPAQINHICTLM